MGTIQELLNTFTTLGINPIYILVIIFITSVIKSFDRKKKIKQGYVLFPFIVSLIICGFEKPFVFQDWIIQSSIHAAVGAYGYNLYSDLIKKRRKPNE